MGLWDAVSDRDYEDTYGPRPVRCERCRRRPVSLPEFDVLCERCRDEEAEIGRRQVEAERHARTRGAA